MEMKNLALTDGASRIIKEDKKMVKKNKHWYSEDNPLGWSEEDFAEVIYDYMQNHITGYNPYNLNFYCPVMQHIFSQWHADIQQKRMGITEDWKKENRRQYLLKQLEDLDSGISSDKR